MKKLRYWWMYIFCLQTATAQSVGIGTTTPDASARLEINSTTQGVLIPKLTAAQRNAIGSPATGLLVFQTDGVPGFCWYNGLAWVSLSNGQSIGSTGFSMSYNRVTTYAGSIRGLENGFGTTAEFGPLAGIAIDNDGDLYVADSLFNRLRKIQSGYVTTLAGDAGIAPGDGPAKTVSVYAPMGIAVDAGGTVYFAEIGNRSIRKISISGAVTTLAASSNTNLPADVPLLPRLANLSDVAVDGEGNVYFTENNMIRKINPAGILSNVAGSTSSTPGFVNGPANTARFNKPSGLTFAGNFLYVADKGNHAIRKIDIMGRVTTLAGTNSAGYVDAVGSDARFYSPSDVAVDAVGNIYVTDTENHRIRKIEPNGNVTTVAGSGTPGFLNGSGEQAQFLYPYSIAVDGNGDLYVTDSKNFKVRKINRQ